jgi:hypothetical protein
MDAPQICDLEQPEVRIRKSVGRFVFVKTCGASKATQQAILPRVLLAF